MSDANGSPAPRLSARERSLLARYVTNTEGPVFALTNLPEVIKGALFSRYSRSTLGLRELLLKEFIQAPEAEFSSIGGLAEDSGTAGEESARVAQLAVERAQDFYDRILDGYGDDSIGELGGAHLAIEHVSMIATKILEDARIGGSPLEKSTRYVYFADKVDGDYLFYKEPALLASPHQALYLETCRALFDRYRDLIEPLSAHMERTVPREDGMSEGAWKRSLRARVFDGLRGLLPASALTNMGIYGNGRFFEALVVRLRLSPLAEMQRLGQDMFSELSKVIPSFVRRADTGHKHFAGFGSYQSALDALLEQVAPPPQPHGGTPGGEPGGQDSGSQSVRLVDWDPDAPAKVLTALRYPAGGLPWQQVQRETEDLTIRESEALFHKLGGLRENRRHKPPRALELAAYTFDLVGDFGMYRDLHRHRMLTQQRQPLTTRLGFETPEEVREAGLADPFGDAMHRAAEAYETLAVDYPAEAQYVVPMAYRIRWQMHVNLRALIWLVELRSSPQGHPAYRRMAQELFRQVIGAHPAFEPLFKFVDMEDYSLGRLQAEQRREERQGA